jgi:hypothetical protein
MPIIRDCTRSRRDRIFVGPNRLWGAPITGDWWRREVCGNELKRGWSCGYSPRSRSKLLPRQIRISEREMYELRADESLGCDGQELSYTLMRFLPLSAKKGPCCIPLGAGLGTVSALSWATSSLQDSLGCSRQE